MRVPCSADDVLEDMPYADAIIKEVMRLHGIVDGVWRQALEDITVQGHSIRKVSAAPEQCTGFLRAVIHTGGSGARQCPWHSSPSPAGHAALPHGCMSCGCQHES